MEDCTTSFFINGLKVHIESSINKYEENKNIVFNKDFDNLFLNPIFINNINLFREIISQNNLNFQVFWNHIGKLMKSSVKNILIKFEEEIKKEKEKENINEETKINIEIGNKNILKLKILIICFYFITTEDSDSFELNKGEDKEKFKNLLEEYIQKEIENKNDFSLFIKNYIIKITLLINDNCRGINLGFLKYLSFTFYNFKTLFTNNEQMNQLKIYIDQAINNPRHELNNYLNGAFNKKCYKKDKLCRSRGASFDIKDSNTNTNNGIEKNNKKIDDFFKSNKKAFNQKNNEEKSGGTKDTDNNINNQHNILNNNIIENSENSKNDINDIKKPISKANSSSTQSKLIHYSSHASNNLSLLNFNSGISNHSYSFGLNNSFSFSKNNNTNNSKLSLDDSLSLTGIFSTPISELNENNDTKNFTSKFPTIIKCVQNKKKKPFDRLKDKFFSSQTNIRNFMKTEKKVNDDDEINELKKLINSSFYGNEKELNKNNKESKEKKRKISKNKNMNKNKDILIYKTPIKNDQNNNQENEDENIKENIDINNIKKNWELLFSQRPDI